MEATMSDGDKGEAEAVLKRVVNAVMDLETFTLMSTSVHDDSRRHVTSSPSIFLR
jgi:hypothetical protein